MIKKELISAIESIEDEIRESMKSVKSRLEDEGLDVAEIPVMAQICIYNSLISKVE